MIDLKSGDKVKFLGCSEVQIQWGGNDDPNGILVVGDEYVIEKVEVHTWHTKLYLKGIKGKFNSSCFEEV
jgi:hypothetical protein